jgi:hypothetical protein
MESTTKPITQSEQTQVESTTKPITQSEQTQVESKTKSVTQSEQTQKEEGQLELLDDWGIETDDIGMNFITGVVVNESQDTLTLVSITFSIFDIDGYKIEDAMDVTETLRPGEKWKFKALIFEDGAASAEPVELTGYPE